MNLILVGCEYAGKTTLADQISRWSERVTGTKCGFHDHFGFPPSDYDDEERAYLQQAPVRLKKKYQADVINYHINEVFYANPDHNLVGMHIEDAVYAPLYYGYGGPGEENYIRTVTAYYDSKIMAKAPSTVLILMSASPEVIRRRMSQNPHKNQIIDQKDIEHIQERFEQEYGLTLIRNKFQLDTTKATVDQTLAEFVDKMEPHLTQKDQLRVQTHQAKLKGLLR